MAGIRPVQQKCERGWIAVALWAFCLGSLNALATCPRDRTIVRLMASSAGREVVCRPEGVHAQRGRESGTEQE